MINTKTITFRTVTQAAIFECEIKGQLSDGKWENTLPMNHWSVWCKAEVLWVDHGPRPHDQRGKIGRNFHAHRDNYNLRDDILLQVVGRCMLGYARLALAGVSLNDIRQLADGVTGPSGEFRGISGFSADHWDKTREWLARWSMDWVRGVLKDESTYNMSHLLADLGEMKVAMRTRIVQ